MEGADSLRLLASMLRYGQMLLARSEGTPRCSPPVAIKHSICLSYRCERSEAILYPWAEPPSPLLRASGICTPYLHNYATEAEGIATEGKRNKNGGGISARRRCVFEIKVNTLFTGNGKSKTTAALMAVGCLRGHLMYDILFV